MEDDSYPLTQQENLLSAVKRVGCISISNQIKSYYQHIVRPDDRYETIIIIHRGQEVFRL